MFDTIIRGGTIVDGTGAPGYVGDIGIRDGRIAALGTVPGPAKREIDAGGWTVCPGFVDVHTHYDAQLLWDPTLSPSAQHGVTTVVAGNCGLSLAPIRERDREFMLRLFSRVEAIPLDALRMGVPAGWESFGEFMDYVEGRGVAVNVGFMVGHAAVRRWVMGPAASEREATDAEIAEMRDLVDDALDHGAMGFSASTASTQFDGDGRPTPSRYASHGELIALAGCCADYPGTSLEFIPASASYGFADRSEIELLAAMSQAGRRPINWNTVLLHYPGKPDIQDLQLDPVAEVAALGGFVVPMIIPHNFRVRTDLKESDVGFRSLEAFAPLFAMNEDERIAQLADPAWQRDMVDRLKTFGEGPNKQFLGQLDAYEVSDTGVAAMAHYVGRKLADIARERGGISILEAMFQLGAEARLDIGFQQFLAPSDTQAQRDLKRRVMRDPRLVLGASDGGAHVRSVLNVEYPTACFKELVREDGVFSVEEMVQELTDVPARLYGLVDRGRIAVGAWADLVIFDPATIGPSPVEMRCDFPGGAPRLFNIGLGIDRVMVAGVDVVHDGATLDARPGQLLRAGKDTADLPWSQMLVRRREPVAA